MFFWILKWCSVGHLCAQVHDSSYQTFFFDSKKKHFSSKKTVFFGGISTSRVFDGFEYFLQRYYQWPSSLLMVW
jgi:hypothetical protein